MLFWKLLFAIDALLLVGFLFSVWRGYGLTRFDLVAIPVELVGSAGLATYAFALPTLPNIFWRAFLPVFLASNAWEIAVAAGKDDRNAGTLIGAVMAALFVGLTAIALYRLGGSTGIGLFGI